MDGYHTENLQEPQAAAMRLATELLEVLDAGAPVSVSLSGWGREGDSLLAEPAFIAFCAAFSKAFVAWPLVLDLKSPFARFVFLASLPRLDVVETVGETRLTTTPDAISERIESIVSAISDSLLLRLRVDRDDLRSRVSDLARAAI